MKSMTNRDITIRKQILNILYQNCMGVKLQAGTVDKDNTMQSIGVTNKVVNFHIFG